MLSREITRKRCCGNMKDMVRPMSATENSSTEYQSHRLLGTFVRIGHKSVSVNEPDAVLSIFQLPKVRYRISLVQSYPVSFSYSQCPIAFLYSTSAKACETVMYV